MLTSPSPFDISRIHRHLINGIRNYKSVSHLQNSVRHILDSIIMSDYYYCIFVFLVNGFDKYKYFLGCLVIKSTCRLIAQKKRRVLDQRTPYCTSLLLSA